MTTKTVEAIAASTTKVAVPANTITTAQKSKTVVSVPVKATPLPTKTVVVGTAAIPAATTVTKPGADTNQPSATGAFVKVKTTSPVTAQPTYS